MNKLIKREYVWCMNPEVYEIAACPNDPTKNSDYIADCDQPGFHPVAWSEWTDRIWCFECGHDFKPVHWGILEGSGHGN